ncbi:MAG: hypothetical protein H6684_09085 [Deltaproteobacteria bacterium]|nr:hypothetical protein [Deltaproteobacteria bacterium]MCB9488871.1 hypothetical protein [Deltaproteobacteria bacterium]
MQSEMENPSSFRNPELTEALATASRVVTVVFLGLLAASLSVVLTMLILAQV